MPPLLLFVFVRYARSFLPHVPLFLFFFSSAGAQQYVTAVEYLRNRTKLSILPSFYFVASNNWYFHIITIWNRPTDDSSKKIIRIHCCVIFYTYNIYTRFNQRVLERGISLKQVCILIGEGSTCEWIVEGWRFNSGINLEDPNREDIKIC